MYSGVPQLINTLVEHKIQSLRTTVLELQECNRIGIERGQLISLRGDIWTEVWKRHQLAKISC